MAFARRLQRVAPAAPVVIPGYPDETNTGTSGVLTAYTGSWDFRVDGEIIENMEISNGGIYIGANNVTFRNCKMVYTGARDVAFTMVNVAPGYTGASFIDCEIDGRDNVARAIKGDSQVTVLRCNIHHTANGVEVGTAFTVEDSYIHEISTPAGMDWHADGIQSGNLVQDVTVRHNTIFLTGQETGCINITGLAGETYTNILIENNLMGGGGYTMYCGGGTNINYQVLNNVFTTQYYPNVGYWNLWYETYISNVVRTGNTIYETGAPANNNSF